MLMFFMKDFIGNQNNWKFPKAIALNSQEECVQMFCSMFLTTETICHSSHSFLLWTLRIYSPWYLNCTVEYIDLMLLMKITVIILWTCNGFSCFDKINSGSSLPGFIVEYTWHNRTNILWTSLIHFCKFSLDLHHYVVQCYIGLHKFVMLSPLLLTTRIITGNLWNCTVIEVCDRISLSSTLSPTLSFLALLCLHGLEYKVLFSISICNSLIQ